MPRLLLLLFGFVLLMLAFGINSCSRLETLRCDRDNNHVRCLVEEDSLFSASKETIYDQIADIEASRLDRSFWMVTLKQRGGGEQDVAKEISEDEAKRVEAWFALREAHVEVARDRYPWHLWLYNIVFGIVLGMIVVGFVWDRRYRRRKAALESASTEA